MLKLFRNITDNWLFKLVLSIIVFSFIGFGVGRNSTNSDLPAVITFNDGRSINYLEFLQAKKQKQAYLQQVAPDAVQNISVDALVIDDLIRERIMQDLAGEYHLVLDSSTLNKYITNSPYFKNDQKQFDDQVFHAFLQQNKLSQQEYLALIKKDLEQHLMTSAFLSSIYIAPEFSQQVSNYAREVRMVKLAKLDMNTTKQTIATNEEDLRQYYEQHENQFMQPKLRSIEYIIVSAKNPKFKVEVTKVEVDEAIIAGSAQADTKQRSKIEEQIKSQKLAAVLHENIDKIEDELAGGMSLDNLATEYQLPVHKLEKVSVAEMIKREPKLRHLKLEEQIADRIPHVWQLENNEGIIILRVTEVTPSMVAPFDKVRDQVKKQYQLAQIKAYNTAKMENCAKEVTADKFKTVALRYGLEVMNKSITRSNNEAAKLPQALVQYLLTTSINQVSPIFYDERFAYIAIVEKITRSPLKEDTQLDAISVKDEIIRSYMQQMDNYYVKKLDVKVKLPSGN